MFYGCHGNRKNALLSLWYQSVRNKILGKVTKFGRKQTKTVGVATNFMVGGTNVPPPPPLGFLGLKDIGFLFGVDSVSCPCLDNFLKQDY